MNKKRIIQISSIVIIIAMIVGLWFIKQHNQLFDDNNMNKHTEQEPGNNLVDENENENDLEDDTKPDPLVGADFTLIATSAINIQDLVKYGLPIIVDYGSEGCMPCQSMKPALKAVHAKMYRKAFIKYIDVWEYPEAAYDLPFNLIPTQIFYNADGTPLVPSEELSRKIQFSFYSDNVTGQHVYTTHTGPLTEAEFDLILKEMGVVYD